MADPQGSLFDKESLARPQREDLLVVAQPGQRLTKAQQAFNRLVAKIEKLHLKLRERTRHLDETLAFFGKHLHPRRVRLAAVRKELVLGLAAFLDRGALKKGERKTLTFIVAQQLATIAQDEGPLVDDALRAVFKRIHGVSFEQIERDRMESARDEMEELLGDLGVDVDVSGFAADMTNDAFAEEMSKLAAQLRQKAQEDHESAFEPDTDWSEHPKTKRQLKKEARAKELGEARKKTIGTIYKQLARALHPDLEPDPAQRQHKLSFMQQLTSAYRDNDLHTLLRLELEWIAREKSDVQRLTDEKLRIYNDLLKEQAANLQQQLEELPFDPRFQAIAIADGPFVVGVIDGPAEARQLDDMIESAEATLARLRTDEALSEVRDSIRIYRASNNRRGPDWTPF